jgi:hypothetical protein
VSYQWLILASLAVVAGFITVKIPGIKIKLSLADIFVFANTSLFGPARGIFRIHSLHHKGQAIGVHNVQYRKCCDRRPPFLAGVLSGSGKGAVLRKYHPCWIKGRPHSSLGPRLPEAEQDSPLPIQKHRHRLQEEYGVKSKAILGGLHHEYWLEKIAA